MKKGLVTLGMVGLSMVGVACSGGADEPPPFDGSDASLAGRLEAATGVTWHVARGTVGVQALVPDSPVRLSSGSAEEQANTFISEYAKDLNLVKGGVTLESRKAEGLEYVRLAQTLPGTNVPVFDTETTMSFDTQGRVEAILPTFRADTTDVATSATLASGAAQELAKTEWAKSCDATGKEIVATEPILGASVQPAGLRLAYRIQVGGLESDCASAQYDIDAATGALLATYGSQGAEDIAGGVRFARGLDPNDKKTLNVTGALGLNAMTSPSLPFQPVVTCSSFNGTGLALTSASPGQWDDGKGAAVDGYFHTMEALRFFHDGLGLNGLDGAGLGVRVVVHDNTALNSYGKNASMAGSKMHFSPALRILGAPVALAEVHIGDGGGDWLPLSAGYDVLAHELGHGVIAYSSKLVYEGESGALNESFADVIGVSAKEWSRLPGHPANLVIGEKFMWSGKGGLRNMENPPAFGHPDHMSKIRRCAAGEAPSQKNDSCYVHSNSGIGNKAFALMVKGGTHFGYGVPKVTTWEAARKIWLRAMTHIPSRSTYLQAAEAQVAESRRFGKDAFLATACAWIAVGVLPPERIVGAKQICQETLELGKPAMPVGCSGIQEGYVCHESVSYSAYVCRNGSIASGINCKDINQRCRPRSATDPRATVDSTGHLVCD